MPEYQLDFDMLDKTLNPDPDKMLLKENKHRIKCVAFDMFKIDGEEDLWTVQTADDGQEFLVRTYNLPEDEKVAESAWDVKIDKSANLNVFYDGVPIQKLAAKDYGAKASDEIDILKDTLKEKLADRNFVQSFLKTLSAQKQKALISLLKQAEDYDWENDSENKVVE